MSESNQGGSAAPSDSSASDPKKPEKFILESDHKRALDDMKKYKAQVADLQTRLSEFDKRDKEIQEKKLAEAGEYQKVIKLKEDRIAELARQVEETKASEDGLKRTLFNGLKLSTVTERLPGRLKNRDYASFIDLDQVALNPETNEIDMDSVDKVVNSFVKQHPSLLETNPKVLPGGMARPAQKLSYEEWLNLPLKEKKLRRKDVEK